MKKTTVTGLEEKWEVFSSLYYRNFRIYIFIHEI